MVYTILHNWKQARSYLEQSHSIAVANHFPFLRAAFRAQLGLSQIMCGQVAEGKRHVSLGLSETLRSKYRRFNQIAADYGAAALAVTSHPAPALQLLDGYTHLRAQSDHARSEAEEQFADWIRGRAGDIPSSSSPVLARSSDLVAMAWDLLESA